MTKKRTGNGNHDARAATQDDVQVGTRIRQFRLQSGLSQTEVGEAVGVTFQQVQKYEKGANRVGAGRLQQFAKLFQQPIAAFFTDTAGRPTKGKPDPLAAFAADPAGVRMAPFFVQLDPHTRRMLASLTQRLAGAPIEA
jgi:transcriptional regulator with XRE-family HTH domain